MGSSPSSSENTGRTKGAPPMSTADDPRAIAARLRAEREKRGWGQRKTARFLRDATDDHQKPDLSSFVTYVKRWESGEVRPCDPRYRAAYAKVFGVSEDELFGPRPQPSSSRPPEPHDDPDERERLALAARNPARLDEAVVDGLAATLAHQRRLEDSTGSGRMLAPAAEHLKLILRLLKEARAAPAARLAQTAAEASQFVGWLHTAVGAYEDASTLYDQALRLGMQSRNTDLAATALSMQGHLAWVTGDIGAMAELSKAAAEMATATGTRAMAVQQSGRALAVLGDRQGALRSIGEAEEILAGGTRADDPDGLYFYGPAYLTMQRGLILSYLAEDPAQHGAAAGLIASGIQALAADVRNSECVAWYRVRAAAAHARGGDITEAVTGLRTALGIVTGTGGGRTRAELVKTHRALIRRWPRHPGLAELGEALR